jgi:hypothetical protein
MIREAKGRRSRRGSAADGAYACFLFSGIAVLAVTGLGAVRMNPGTAGTVGFLVAIPVALVTLGAMALGVLLTIVLRRERPLVILSGMTLLFLAVVVTEPGPGWAGGLVSGTYGLGVAGVCGWWFLSGRKRGPEVEGNGPGR